MEYFVIADEDTVLGFRYAGIEGRVVRTPEEARDALSEQVRAGRAGIVIMTEEIAEAIRSDVNALRFESGIPIVVEIPGPDGPAAGRRELEAVIREAVGVRV